MYLCLYLGSIGTTTCLMDQKQESLNEIGVLITKSEPNVVLLKDSILVTMVYKLTDVRGIFNNFIEQLDSISMGMGKK